MLLGRSNARGKRRLVCAREVLLLAAAALALLPRLAAHAAGWKQVTASGGANIDEVSPVADRGRRAARRLEEGRRPLPHGDRGRWEGRRHVADPVRWAGTSDPAIVAVARRPAGVLGRHPHRPRRASPTRTSTPRSRPTAARRGRCRPGTIVPIGAQAYASDTSATTLPGGNTLQAWFGTLGTWVHAGLDPATPNLNFQAPLGGYGYDPEPGRGRNAGGAMLAWFSNSTGRRACSRRASTRDGSPAARRSDAGHDRDGRRPLALAHADRLAAEERRLLRRQRRRLPDRDRSASGASDRARRRCWTRPGSTPETAVATDSKGRAVGGLDRRRVRRRARDGGALEPRRRRASARRSTPGAAKNAHSALLASTPARRRGARRDRGCSGSATTSSASTYVTRVLPGLTLAAKRIGTRVTSPSPTPATRSRARRSRPAGKSGKTDSKGRAVLAIKGKATAQATAKGYEPAILKLK